MPAPEPEDRKTVATPSPPPSPHRGEGVYRGGARVLRAVGSNQALRIGLKIVVSIAILVTALRLWPHAPLESDLSYSTAIYDRHGQLLRLTLASDDRYRLPVRLDHVSPHLVDAVLLKEDRWYYWHLGVNPYSLMRGFVVSYVQGGVRQGGSTITMQLARLKYRLNTRTPVGKLRQAALALWLELRHSKRELLEAYLARAPYGGNVEGVATASRIYFGKPVAQLALPEALALAVIPQQPGRAGAARYDRLEAARARLTADWLVAHPRDAERAPLMQLPIALTAAKQLPFRAPHFVDQVLQSRRMDGGTSRELTTTLDLDLQRLVERQVSAAVARGDARGIRNAAVLLLDARDMGVRALVGSADYFRAEIAGQVNVTQGKRSPGSTLKPFIYALALDQGVLHPLTVLRDVPSAYGPYQPENFDSRFLGPVTATEALVRSRNIPAVDVAARLTRPNLYEFLRHAGISRMLGEDHYGLALVLGGGEVTPQELARLYAMLANQGELRAPRLLTATPDAEGPKLLSAEASYLTLDMLSQNPRPDQAASAELSRYPVAWKTGTSWGFRDAWSAGVLGPYVLVVWIGNSDGAGNPAFTGIEAAAPLFFAIADALRAREPAVLAQVRPSPQGLSKVEVCLASGDLPNAWCPERGLGWFIPGKSPIRVSTIHRPVWIDRESGRARCGPDPDGRAQPEVYEFWSSDLAQVFARAGIPRRKPPVANCELGNADDGEPPHFSSPLRGAVYTVRASRDSERIAFSAVADADVSRLYWFVDDSYVGDSLPGRSLFWDAARAGTHTVRVVDDHGRADSRELRVAAVE